MTKLMRSGQIELHFPADNLFIHKNSPAPDLFRLNIGVALAGYYSSAIRDNVKRRFDQKLADGEWPGKAPIGYKNIITSYTPKGEPIKDIALDSDRHELVKKALEMRAMGISYGAITKFLRKKACAQRCAANLYLNAKWSISSRTHFIRARCDMRVSFTRINTIALLSPGCGGKFRR